MFVWTCECGVYTEHRCERAGCRSVLVLDGNMKNNREVCSAKLAGYSEFAGLAGRVRTGCPNTPALKSRYCQLHMPVASQLDEDELEETHTAIIISKRVTRQSIFYQVNFDKNCIIWQLIELIAKISFYLGRLAGKTWGWKLVGSVFTTQTTGIQLWRKHGGRNSKGYFSSRRSCSAHRLNHIFALTSS